MRAEQTPFEVKLRDFGRFEPRVIFVDIVPNPKLSALAAKLAVHLERRTRLKRETEETYPFSRQVIIKASSALP